MWGKGEGECWAAPSVRGNQLAGPKQEKERADWAAGKGWAGLFWVWASSRVWAPFLFLFLFLFKLKLKLKTMNSNKFEFKTLTKQQKKRCSSMNATTKFNL